jgi:geranylgeranyl reductase family protein
LDLECDVAIVGAGPAGAVAAHDLARGGLRTILIDQAPPPRHKTCGGGVLAKALRHLPCPIDAAVGSACRIAELGDVKAGLAFRVVRDASLVAMTMRSELDALLAAAARRAGAAMLAPRRVERLAHSGDRVRLATDGGAVTARFAIGADGAAGVVARQAGWPGNLRSVPALEWEMPVAPDTLARHAGIARFDFGVVAHGYAWVFPKRAHVTIGILSTARRARGLRDALAAYAARLMISAAGPVSEHGATIPSRLRRGGFSRGRVLLAGDAAGLVDPLLFEGITFAVASGRAAASAILSSPGDAASVGRAYEDALRREVLPEIRCARLLAPLVYSGDGLRAFVFRRWGQELSEAMADVVAGARTYRSLLGRPASWARLFRR